MTIHMNMLDIYILGGTMAISNSLSLHAPSFIKKRATLLWPTQHASLNFLESVCTFFDAIMFGGLLIR